MSLKTTIAKMITGAALAGALLFAAPHKAEAQRVGFGVTIGTGPVYSGYYSGYYGPRYVRPYPYYNGYYGPAYYGPRYYGHGYYGPRPYYGRPYARPYGGGYYRGGYRR